jgi:2-keto-4-pentenoate hydratase/2-oxohepta-3-ene-1,7-dioic acid hydratase in catechol pathway
MSVPFSLCTVEAGGRAVPCVERDGRYFRLPKDLMALLADGVPLDTLKGGEEVKADRVLTPLQYPGKVLCAGANYYDHLKEMGVPDLRKEAQRLFFFFKPPRNALVGPGKSVRYPADSKMLDWEVELAAVIGRRSRRLTLDNAIDAVAAWTIGIDLSARDLNRAPETFYKLDWVAGKAQDTCCPLGPRLVPAKFIRNPQDLALKLSVNGAVKQDARTSGMIFDLREQLVTLSAIMTLDPGDVVLTGTPAGVGFPKGTFLKPGDRVEAEIESIGRLSVEIGEPS